MEIIVHHPSGEIELFPIEENQLICTLDKHLKKIYRCFNLTSNGVHIKDKDVNFSTLEIPEVWVVMIEICNNCNAKPKTRAALSAALNGHLDCLMYLYKNIHSRNRKTTWWAANGGHLDCLKYLHENRCPWDVNVMAQAAAQGHLECLKYLHENKCPWDSSAMGSAATHGHLNCIKYLHENGCPWADTEIWNAINNKHLDCIKYLRENRHP